mgnify:FL=1|tara:strand:+ start:1795 stop:2064 length:270 start_codon:yes stop_codon:yes gene_type:complete
MSRDTHIAKHDVNSIVSIDTDTLQCILRDDLMNSLLTELGIHMFNQWYVETIGGEAPFKYFSTNPASSKLSYFKDLEQIITLPNNKETK